MIKKIVQYKNNYNKYLLIVHPWCGSYFTSISACRVWGVRTGVQVSKRGTHTHIHLDEVRVEFLFCIKK